jgi:hypothetical protein
MYLALRFTLKKILNVKNMIANKLQPTLGNKGNVLSLFVEHRLYAKIEFYCEKFQTDTFVRR